MGKAKSRNSGQNGQRKASLSDATSDFPIYSTKVVAEDIVVEAERPTIVKHIAFAASLLVIAICIYSYLHSAIKISGVAVTVTLALVALSLTLPFSLTVKVHLQFAWNCFLRPFLVTKNKKNDASQLATGDQQHQARLERFYESQADIYDVTRERLLRGRDTMLALCVPGNPNAINVTAPITPHLVWLDIGGGTGSNIEKMHAHYPITNFHRVYLVDITPSLCRIARERFIKLGWTNVRVVCADAATFTLPAPESDDDVDAADVEVALITTSYSLSMIDDAAFYPVVDQLSELLSAKGIFGVADFGVARKREADSTRRMGWSGRWFWQMWFDLDNVYLHPSRRQYIEHKFAPLKLLNCKNDFIPYITKIPYYVCIASKKTAPSGILSQVKKSASGDSLPALDDYESNALLKKDSAAVLDTVGTSLVTNGGRWRQPFDFKLCDRFSTYIYAFTWEDPDTDLHFMDLRPSDRMLVITSGGENVLKYITDVGPARIHCVDFNPCQNNMLELKLAGLSSLTLKEFHHLFAEGFPNHSRDEFHNLLLSRMSPHLSSQALAFWLRPENSTFTNLYNTGGSGLAIRAFNLITRLARLRPAVERMCDAPTLAVQREVWEKEIRPYFLSPLFIRLLNNNSFLWSALGVPPAQMAMLMEEGSAYKYIVDTFDPVINETHLRTENYFYYMPLMGRYSGENCPSYMTEKGFNLLCGAGRLDAIKIHTDRIVSVLENGCGEEDVPGTKLTRVILMDHLDWFTEADADAEVAALSKQCATGAKVFWRSASKHPWYGRLFEAHGFEVFPLQIRQDETMCIDRVNMYASLWCGVKM
ncbi:uncharacterized protein EV422DRAFT_592058 [Fimicolochytrium jonesii]|uniref:uncharacterized protein n=1 Tax=Fimicolochytrium jonesii TaxID=1396493 RepID=UPI0022FE02D3|nr:uncharacterized protein EV422DRAFT_592058 [Fimicolochytrium jonesii]KAI8816112.1 hypothetical protein EV422DRAFT_592058 [Fimicolochytrium jonesii]